MIPRSALLMGFALAGLTACSSGNTLTAPKVDAAVESPSVTCHLEETSDLPGVAFHVTRDDCTFTLQQVRAGITIPYQLTVDHDTDIVPQPSPGTYCYPPGETGLLIGSRLTGDGQLYCRCDEGLPSWSECERASTVKAGVHALSFEWDGVNWTGPSDTQNPKGKPFPAGVYRLDITAKGFVGAPDAGGAAFTVAAAFNVNVIE